MPKPSPVCFLPSAARLPLQALAEANILNNSNAAVWAYLALVCATVSPPRRVEASQALEQALRNGIADAALLRELANAHFEIDDLPAAEMLLRRSLMAQDSPHTRARLADVLKMQNKPADLPQQELA